MWRCPIEVYRQICGGSERPMLEVAVGPVDAVYGHE
jgi:hypothetical protein